MSIRFNCLACRMVLKVAEMIVEERKVRCTGCGIVLLLSPDPSSETGISATLPEQPIGSKRKSDKELARRRKLVLGALGILALGLVIGLWIIFKPPSDRAPIQGEVLLDDRPLEKGKIIFEDEVRGIAIAEIEKGRYRLSVYSGPRFGSNRIMIYGDRPTGKMALKIGGRPGEEVEVMDEAVDKRFNTHSKATFDVKPGANTADFKVYSK